MGMVDIFMDGLIIIVLYFYLFVIISKGLFLYNLLNIDNNQLVTCKNGCG